MSVPYSWYNKEDLQQLETSLKLELHAIMKVHGSDSPEFWEQHKELVAVQAELYGKPKATIKVYGVDPGTIHLC